MGKCVVFDILNMKRKEVSHIIRLFCIYDTLAEYADNLLCRRELNAG